MDGEACQLPSPWDSVGENTGVGCHFPSPGDLPGPGTEPGSLALQESLRTELQRKLINCLKSLFLKGKRVCVCELILQLNERNKMLMNL